MKCAICGEEIKSLKAGQKYCSDKCRKIKERRRSAVRYRKRAAQQGRQVAEYKPQVEKAKAINRKPKVRNPRPMTPALERFFTRFAILLKDLGG